MGGNTLIPPSGATVGVRVGCGRMVFRAARRDRQGDW